MYTWRVLFFPFPQISSSHTSKHHSILVNQQIAGAALTLIQYKRQKSYFDFFSMIKL